MNTRAKDFPFYQYASQFWATHTRQEEQFADVQNAALKFLGSKHKINSMLEMEAYPNSSGGYISFVDGQTSLHVAASAGLATICGLILDRMQGANVRYILIVNII